MFLGQMSPLTILCILAVLVPDARCKPNTNTLVSFIEVKSYKYMYNSFNFIF